MSKSLLNRTTWAWAWVRRLILARMTTFKVRKLLMEQWHLVQTGLDVPLHGGLFEVLDREVLVIHLVTILAPGLARHRAGVGEVQRRIAPQLGNEV